MEAWELPYAMGSALKRQKRKESEKEYIERVYFAIHLKLTQHCLLTLLQFKKKKGFKKSQYGYIYKKKMLKILWCYKGSLVSFCAPWIAHEDDLGSVNQKYNSYIFLCIELTQNFIYIEKNIYVYFEK